MHTVNTAYTVLRQEGVVKVDRRKGAIIAVNVDKLHAIEEMEKEMEMTLAKARCKDISKEEIHEMIDKIYDNYSV